MTTAPAGLLEARRLLLDHLDMHPGPVHSDLDPAEVGIVGDADHLGGYHCGSDRVRRNASGVITDYSVIESNRDRAGLDLDAAGFDIGYFRVITSRGTFDLYDMNVWLVAECERGGPFTQDIREVIYSPDGVTVKRWDRLGRRTTGDSSHKTHTHTSEFRDANGRNMKALMERWLVHIGLLEDAVTQPDPFQNPSKYASADGKTRTQDQKLHDLTQGLGYGRSFDPAKPYWVVGQVQAITAQLNTIVATQAVILRKLDELAAAVAAIGTLPAPPPPDLTAAVADLKAEVRDAVADGLEGGSAAVRADPDA